jgi:hypothetical protein
VPPSSGNKPTHLVPFDRVKLLAPVKEFSLRNIILI